MHSLTGTKSLVGREAELSQLDSSLEQLAAERGGCLAVEGDAGIGKTSLLAELRARADRAGHLVLGGSAAEFERDVPFSVWIDALDAYVGTRDLSAHPAWTPELAATLGTVLPALRTEGGAAAPVAGRADALTILGQVRQHGEEHEAAHEVERGVQVQRFQPQVERLGVAARAVTLDRSAADRLRRFEQAVPALGADHVAQKLAE